MSEAYVGEIRLVGFNYAPVDWALCNGQLINISDNETLYTLIGVSYGGDGVNTFALPDLRSRVPLHAGTDPQGNVYTRAQVLGSETVTLNSNQVGIHTHPVIASGNAASQASPAGAYPAVMGNTQFYSTDTTPNVTPLAANSTTPAGNGGPHNNLMPYQCVNYIICLYGQFPPHSN